MKSWLVPFLFPFFSVVTSSPMRNLPTKFVSPQEIPKFRYYSQYAAAAYCSNNLENSHNQVACPAGNCPLVEGRGIVTLTAFRDLPNRGPSGFVAFDERRNEVVVTFRGTHTPDDWFTNANSQLVDTGHCEGCRGHAGFFQAWKKAKPQVMSAVQDALQQSPDAQVVIAGHSSGAAVGSFAGLDLPGSIQYLYGPPKVGNQALSNQISESSKAVYRFNHKSDPFVDLPPFKNYAYINPEYVITGSASEMNSKSSIFLVSRIAGFLQPFTGGFDPTAHFQYFGEIAACT